MRAKASSWKREPFAAGDASDAGAEVEEALMSSAQNQAAMDLEYGAQLLDFLISNLLLGQSKPFPRPAAVKEPMPGLYQHHVAGTGYRETSVDAKAKKPS